MTGREDDLGRCRQQHRAVVASQLGQVDLDADLEQEQHDPDVGQQLELLAVGDVAGRERREAQPDGEVADDRGEVQAARQPAGGDRGQEDEADLEDGRRVGVHPGMVPARARRRTSATRARPPRRRRPGDRRRGTCPSRQAMRMATAVTATMIVEIALISGVTPNRIFE